MITHLMAMLSAGSSPQLGTVTVASTMALIASAVVPLVVVAVVAHRLGTLPPATTKDVACLVFWLFAIVAPVALVSELCRHPEDNVQLHSVLAAAALAIAWWLKPSRAERSPSSR